MKREFLKKNYGNIQKIIFLLVIIFQIAVICHWASRKSNYFVDELFSFGYAHSYTFNKKDVGYIDNSPEWKYEEWISNEVLKTQLEVSPDESLLRKNPVSALKMLLTRRNYHGFLNIIMDVCSSGKTSVWAPIIFNLVLFVFSQVILFRIVYEMTHSFPAALLAVFMYGFSGTAINTHLFIRFYAWVLFLVLCCIRLHQKMWQEKRVLYFSLETIFGMLLLFFALKNSELIMIMGGAIVMVFATGLLIRTRFKEAILYILMIVPASLVYLVKKTSLVNIVFHPDAYQNKGGATGWITNNLLSVNCETIISRIFKYLRWFSDQVFGSWYVLCSFLVLVIILLEVRILGRKKAPKPVESDVENRREADLTDSDIEEQKLPEVVRHDAEDWTATGDVRFAWVILSASAVYYVFALLTGLRYIRYFSFFFPLVIILLWTLIGILTRNLKYKKYVYAICFVLAGIGAFSLQTNRPEVIENIYANDRALIKAVQDTDIHNVVVICTDREDANHSIYDCIHLLPYTAEVYPINMEHHHIDAADFPDQVLVWSNGSASSDDYTKDLLEAGYSLEKFGTSHASVVYVANKG